MCLYESGGRVLTDTGARGNDAYCDRLAFDEPCCGDLVMSVISSRVKEYEPVYLGSLKRRNRPCPSRR